MLPGNSPPGAIPNGFAHQHGGQMLHSQLAWYIAGPALGLCVVACRALFNGRLGVTGGYSEGVGRPRGRRSPGSLVFGVGWGISDACPGPIATQIGQGIAWGLPTIAGVLIGVYLFIRRFERETEPATDAPTIAAGLAPGG